MIDRADAAAASRSSSSSSRDERHRTGSKVRYRQTTNDDDDNRPGIDEIDTSDWLHDSSLIRDRQSSNDGGKVRREPGTVYLTRACSSTISENTHYCVISVFDAIHCDCIVSTCE